MQLVWIIELQESNSRLLNSSVVIFLPAVNSTLENFKHPDDDIKSDMERSKFSTWGHISSVNKTWKCCKKHGY